MISSIIISIIAGISTFQLSQLKAFGIIRSSALLSLIAYGILYLLTPNYELLSIVFFGASFVGMSCSSRMHNITVTISSIIFAIFFHYLAPLLKGYGGALGLSAFLSVAIIQLFLHLFGKLATSR